MKITFNVTGAERKSLVGAISQELNAQTKYLGAPTFAYEVGGYHIDKVGTVVGLDDEELVCKLAAHGFAGEVEYDNLPPHGEPAYDEAAWHDTCDREERDEDGNWDGNETPYYREPRYTEEEFGLGVRRTEDFQGENGMRADDVPEPNALVIEVPLTGFTPEKLDNLAKLVKAKEGLLKAALGAENLPIQQTDENGGKLRFPWFDFGDECAYDYGDKVKAYATLVEKLCKAAKEKHRVTAKERDTDGNPKYAMRCWLLSLGFIGDEYKVSRKILLSRLDGNGSFKGGSRPTYTAHCYTYPNGSEEDAMDCATEEFTSLAKAKAHCDAFLSDCESLKFAGAHVEDDNGAYLYEILTDGTVNEQ